MFKKALISSIIFHLLLFTGLGVVSNDPRNHRTAQMHSLLIVAALDSETPSETSVFVKDKTARNNGQWETGIRTERSLLKDQWDQTEGLTMAEETPPVLTDSEKLNPENAAIEQGGYEVESKGSLNPDSSGLADKEGAIGSAGNQPSPEANQPDQLPVKIHNPSPGYPLKARENNWEGVTVLKILVQADGKIGEVTVLESSGYPLLDQVAVKAVKQWRYRPALKNGVAVAWQIRVRIKFVLEG